MAKELTVKELKQINTINYNTIRSELKTGDVVFCSGNYLFSKIIQKFTKSTWSHVGIIYRDEQLDRILILESEKLIGVRFAPLSKYIKDYHGKNKPYKGQIAIARLNTLLDQELLKKGIRFGMDELTKPYDNYEIIRIALRILFNKGKREKDRKYICSELVYECYKKAGLEFQYHNTLISPDDIWKDNNLEFKFRVL